jgi:hypothetical protein
MSTTSNARKWDETRTAFASSILVDTALSSLAENVDVPAWPGTDKSETPATYIDFELDEVVEQLGALGYPENTVELLISILQETLAFDDPFGEMVTQSEEAAAASNPLLENLERLQISSDYPIALTGLSADTQEFCQLERLSTVGQFAVFAQSMSQSVIVGGDFRGLLNALSHVDEKAVARFLPFRLGAKGLHLPEAMAFVVKSLRDSERNVLQRPDGEVSEKIERRVQAVVDYFAAELSLMDSRLKGASTLARELIALQDPAMEDLVAKLLRPHLAHAASTKKSGWFARLFGR